MLGKTPDEDVTWAIDRSVNDSLWTLFIYEVENTTAINILHVNKGHEAMVYLTYIIDHYDDLQDITVFMHAHQFAWHNNDLLSSDSSEMVNRLRASYVVDQGYVNLRCGLTPGCPEYIKPLEIIYDPKVPEASVIAESWHDISPETETPSVLSQPCCAQFAVSRNHIRYHPKSRFIELRDWLLKSELSDSLTGRVFEYLWQFILGRVFEHCPTEDDCYCNLYEVCPASDNRTSLYIS